MHEGAECRLMVADIVLGSFQREVRFGTGCLSSELLVSILRVEGKGLLEFLDGYIPHLVIGIGETFGLVSCVVGKERLHQFVSNLRTEVGVAAESYIGQQFHEPFTALVNGNVAVEFHGRTEQRVAIAIEIPALLPQLCKDTTGALCIFFKEDEQSVNGSVSFLEGVLDESVDTLLVGFLVALRGRGVQSCVVHRDGEQACVVGQCHIEYHFLAQADESLFGRCLSAILRQVPVLVKRHLLIEFVHPVEQRPSEYGKEVGFFGVLRQREDALCRFLHGGRQEDFDFLSCGQQHNR